MLQNPFVVFLHLDPVKLVPLYWDQIKAKFPDAIKVARVESAYSSGYQRDTGGIAAKPLGDWLRSVGWNSKSPVILIAFSAGCFAVRDWLQNADNRKIPSAILLVDGLHSGFGPDKGCKWSAVKGVYDFAVQPGRQTVITYSTIQPPTYASVKSCAKLLEPQLMNVAADAYLISGVDEYGEPYFGDVPGLTGSGGDQQAHVQQAMKVGPACVKHLLLPYMEWAEFPPPGFDPGKDAGKAIVDVQPQLPPPPKPAEPSEPAEPAKPRSKAKASSVAAKWGMGLFFGGLALVSLAGSAVKR